MNFNDKFDKTAVLDFLKNQFLPDDFTENREAVKFTPGRIKEIEYIGESKSLELKLFVIRHESEHDPRVALSRETFRVMGALGAQRALAIFHSSASPNWRLSLATIELSLKGAKTKREYSNPRRYSFFLGPDAKTHTPEQFLSEKVTDYSDLLKRFSIEVVNKEFYNEIAIKFTELVGGRRKVKTKVVDFDKPALRLPSLDMSKPESHIAAQEFAVRLIGRIVFCWFLKKKKSPAGVPLLPDSMLSKSAVLVCEKVGDSYYHSVLENLFFQALNSEMSERADEFKKSPYNKIPFLNGGLFEPHDDDRYEIIGGVPQVNFGLKISNAWFVGLFQILETYNFTIDENTSVDVELAVDPEMLGRIFENLLAEINPETGETARKSTGSYYTPRPIVEYMVDESLKAYLKTKTAISDEKLSDLLSYSESDTELSEPEKEKVIAALDEVKIIDPACGSGAFPMGMLQKIVLVLQKVDPDSQKWLTKLLDSVPDPTARALLRNKLEGEDDLWNYTRKLGVIRKSIYGVDIQPIAVEISKLRFFLSLVVDEKVDDKKKNRAIEPLPNLEFKFVCANTLIGLPKAEAELFDDLRDIDALKNLRDKYFTAAGQAKLKVENDFLSTQHKMLMRSMGWGKADTKAMKLSQWVPFKNKSTEWFDPEWMFGLKGGFDIVIANPPYVDSEHMTKSMPEQRKLISELYQTASGNWDLYIPFWELAFSSLAKNGIAVFITPNKWLSIEYGRALRELLTSHLIRLGNCDQIDVFEAGNSPVIIFASKDASKTLCLDIFKQTGAMDKGAKVSAKLLDYFDMWGFLLSSHVALLQKISQAGGQVKNSFTASSTFSVSEAYELIEILQDAKTKESFNPQKHLKFVNTGTIDPFCSLWGNKVTTYIKHKYSFPCIDKKEFSNKFPKRWQQISSPKIAISGMRHFEAMLDVSGNVVVGKSAIILRAKSDLADYNFILGLLNSKLITFYIKEVFGSLGIDGGITFTPNLVNNLPVPGKMDEQISKIVGKILELKSKHIDADTAAIESEIDQRIYKLYGLTQDEIEIIEHA